MRDAAAIRAVIVEQLDAFAHEDAARAFSLATIDTDGRAWIALYPMQRQADGGWRIDGCQLQRLPGQAI